MNKKIGLGIITCNRKDFFMNCMDSIIENNRDIDEIIVVNDSGDPLHKAYEYNDAQVHHIFNAENCGVAKTKNTALQYLLDKECDYIFLIEDDIIIKDPDVFNKYIELHEMTGLHHFNFGYHGPANKQDSTPMPRTVINYGDKIKLALNLHCVGAFSFYTKECLINIGLMDETFVNAWEHVEHTYQLFKSDYHTPFWWFADLANSYDYLDEQACSEVNSTIRVREDWSLNIQNGLKHFVSKHGVAPGTIKDTSQNDVITLLKDLKGIK